MICGTEHSDISEEEEDDRDGGELIRGVAELLGKEMACGRLTCLEDFYLVSCLFEVVEIVEGGHTLLAEMLCSFPAMPVGVCTMAIMLEGAKGPMDWTYRFH